MFQKTVIDKYLRTQNSTEIAEKWAQFKSHFHNPLVQENIRGSKEEQYQEGFFRDLFVSVLGYTLNPAPDFNLTTELRNVKDAKKADGGIVINERVVGVIELKGMDTTDLGKVEQQAFNYKNNQTGCTYVIISNFQKLRLYVDDSVNFTEFNLFELTEEQFAVFYLLLSYNSVHQDIPQKIKGESVSQEDIITKKLYKDYSVFKRELFQNLIDLNPQFDQLELFRKTQKLLDRLLFLYFGEDRGLLPPNSVRMILEDWNKLNDLDESVPLYNRFKKYFGYLNTGFKGKNHDVFAYNGGLFKPDAILDKIKINDQLLYKHSLALSEYDFASEVDVNILGHIFENSLNEIDEVKAQLEGKEIDKSKTKRKKDGVFYTPKYITKYIVENTVGKLCEEKKDEFGILEEEYFTGKKRQQKTLKSLLSKLDDYRAWLLQITIVDPACGSGAFLNEALNFLIEEHQYIDELEAKLRNVPIIFSYHSESILEHNLFGVDLNEESVEIAKLSLWLRTAEPSRKLNSLNDNIKCGNSLIDDPEVAGEKAFNWEKEFPQVFAKGGFDVVIGNPPYVNFVNLPKSEREFFKTNFVVTKNKTDLYAFFIEKSSELLKRKGMFSFIFPHTWTTTTSFEPLRRLLISKFSFDYLVELEHGVFADAIVKTNILVARLDSSFDGIKILKNDFSEVVTIPKDVILSDSELTVNFGWNETSYKIESKLFDNSISLREILKFSRGIKTSDDKRFLSFERKSEQYKRVIRGRNIKGYMIEYANEYIWYRPDLMKEKVGSLPHSKKVFEVSEKLVTQRVNSSGQLLVAYDNIGYYCLDTTNVSIWNDENYNLKYFLTVLNSKLINWWFNGKYQMPTISGYELASIPIKFLSVESQQPFIEKANQMLLHTTQLQEILAKFQGTVEREFFLETLSKRSQTWYQIPYVDFLKELKKQKIELSLAQKADWQHYYDQQKEKVLEVQSQIALLNKEIDQMVYELYGLTEEEIEIVENS